MAVRPPHVATAAQALHAHWPEYLMEALGLGIFMVSACAFGTLLEHPASPVRQAIADPNVRRALMGLAMGLTAIGLIYSPWGTRSGAHMNPAVTLAFARLGHVRRWDIVFYPLAQFAGGVLGVALMARLLGPLLAHPAVNFVVTKPGAAGQAIALGAEVLMSFGLMLMVVQTTTRPQLMAWTGVFAGTLVAFLITVEAPISGMSMNPARSFATAAVAGQWIGWWIYLVAPPLGMLAAVELSCALRPIMGGCAKLHHPADVRCIFCGRTGTQVRAAGGAAAAPAKARATPPIHASASASVATPDPNPFPGNLSQPAGIDAGEASLLKPSTTPTTRGRTMNSRGPVIALIVVIVLGAGWYLFRPERLFVNQKVNESLNVAPAAMSAMESKTDAAVLASGMFHNGSHETSGTATIHKLPDGSRVLRLTDFHTSNGPDVQVYLVAATDASDNETVTKAGFVSLGALKGNVGDQNYTLPADLDLDTYRAVTIWCRRFGVNFGTAPLTVSGTMDDMSGTMGSVMESAMPGMGAPATLVAGSFHSVAHETMGQATVYRLAGGKRVLRLTEFHTSNGPDVQVYLVAAPDASDNATVTKAGFVHLAALKGNQGDQNYELPADLDLGKYRAVTIWCRRFGVNFGTAPLTPVS